MSTSLKTKGKRLSTNLTCKESLALKTIQINIKQSKNKIKYMIELKVYTLVTLEWCKQQGLTPVSTRWLYTNKGDLDMPEIRARLVARETRRVSELSPEDAEQTFAATPPVEALRFL